MLKQILSRNNLISITILVFGLAISVAIVFAQTGTGAQNAPQNTPTSISQITFPIPELGNCANQNACKIYCDDQSHIEACISFARKNNLMSADEAARARAFVREGNGPGGCKSREECENFCNDPANIETCVQFAKNHGLMKKEEVDEAEKVEQVLKQGISTPGNCRGRQQCESYCSDSTHSDECLAFAQKAGLIKPEEINRARQMMNLMAQGKTPGGCKSKDECMNYCQSGGHMDECLKFGVDNGMMTQQQAEVMKQTGGVGPGGCHGQECKDFCNNPANQQVCFKFAEDHNLISQDQIKDIKEGFSRLRQNLKNMPPEITQCLKTVAGENIIDDIESGKLMPGPEIGEQIKSCFEKFNKGFGPNSQGENQGGFQNNNNQGFPNNSSSSQSWQGQQEQFQPCPKMPTVGSCPSGQEKFLIFKSSKCGEYYGCRPSSVSASGQIINATGSQSQQFPPPMPPQFQNQNPQLNSSNFQGIQQINQILPQYLSPSTSQIQPQMMPPQPTQFPQPSQIPQPPQYPQPSQQSPQQILIMPSH